MAPAAEATTVSMTPCSRAPFPPRCGLAVVVLLTCCAGLYLLLWTLLRGQPGGPLAARSRQGRPDLTTTARPFKDFIDPDLAYLRRMFHSGGLARRAGAGHAGHGGARGGSRSTAGRNVTLFRGQEGVQQHHPHHDDNNDNNTTTCVPFHAPGNRTLKICVYDRTADPMISSYLRDYGVWEKELVEGMVHVLDRDDLDRAGRRLRTGPQVEEQEEGRLSVVDVGCNLGVYTLAAASAGHRVLAVDPLRSALRLLDASLRLNRLRANVTLLLNALSDRPGPVHVHLNPANVGGSSVSRARGRESRAGPRPPVVRALCLDDLVPLVPTGRVLLKLDIEGWEAAALRCGSEFFQRLDVRCVLTEWLFFRHGRSGARVIDFMVRNGLLPYSDVTQTTVLTPDRYHTWPDNVWWVKR